jgi:chromosomal replication initiation ATPase DnaA
MLDAWLARTRDWLSRSEALLPLPEQEFAGWALDRALRRTTPAAASGLVATICGESGSGKTLLVRRALRPSSATERRRVVAADADEWVRCLADNVAFPAGPGDVVVCENLHRLANPQQDGDRLAAWLDSARQERVAVLVTCLGLPSSVVGLSARLRNRLHGGIVASIRPLGEESQRRLIELWISQGIVPPGTAAWLSGSSVTTAGQLRKALVEGACQNESRRPAVPPSRDGVSLDLVAELVANDFQVSLADLRSGARAQGLQIPRGVAMSLARELTNHPLVTIGRHFGCRSHTSVVRSCSRLQQLLPETPTLREQVQQLRAKLLRELSADCG